MPQAPETYESLNLEARPIRPHILAASTVVFGPDYYDGKRETISLSGFVQINKWPMEGFGHRVDDRGHAEFDLELISAPEVGIKGYSYTLDDRIQVLSNPYLPNTGSVRQIVPGRNFPARFHVRRFGILETSALRLAHRDVIDIEGLIDGIPPYRQALTPPYHGAPLGDGPATVVKQTNVVAGVNLPEAWYPADDGNNPVGSAPVAFFADSIAPCKSMMLDPSFIIQASTVGHMSVAVEGRQEVVEIAGDHAKAAGVELLLFGPDKHDQGERVLAQLARVALVGESELLGGRVMLRISFMKVSGGAIEQTVGRSLSDVRFPAEIGLDAHFEICTPEGVLYGARPFGLEGRMGSLEADETALRTVEGPVRLTDAHRSAKAQLVGVDLRFTDAIVGTEAYVGV